MSSVKKKNLDIYCKSSYVFLVVAACAVASVGEESSATPNQRVRSAVTSTGGGLNRPRSFSTGSIGGGTGGGNLIRPRSNSLPAGSSNGLSAGSSLPSGTNTGGATGGGNPTGKVSHKYGNDASNFRVVQGVNPEDRYVQFTNTRGELVTYKEGLAAKMKLLLTRDEIGIDTYVNSKGEIKKYIYKTSPRWVSGQDIIDAQSGSQSGTGSQGQQTGASGVRQPGTSGQGQTGTGGQGQSGVGGSGQTGTGSQGQQPGDAVQGVNLGAARDGLRPVTTPTGGTGDQGQPGTGSQGQPGASGSGQSGTGGQGQSGAGSQGQPGASGSGQSGTGSQGQPGTSGSGQSGTGGQGQSGTGSQGQSGTSGQGQQPGASGSGQSGSGSQGQPGASGSGQSGTGGQGQSGTSGQGQQPGASGSGQSGAGSQGQPGTSGQGQSGTSGRGQSGTGGQGQSGTGGQGQSGAGSQGQSGTSGQGQSGTSGRGQSGTGGQGQSGASGQGQSGASGSGQSGTGGQGQSGTSGRGQSGASGLRRPGVSSTGQTGTGGQGQGGVNEIENARLRLRPVTPREGTGEGTQPNEFDAVRRGLRPVVPTEGTGGDTQPNEIDLVRASLRPVAPTGGTGQQGQSGTGGQGQSGVSGSGESGTSGQGQPGASGVRQPIGTGSDQGGEETGKKPISSAVYKFGSLPKFVVRDDGSGNSQGQPGASGSGQSGSGGSGQSGTGGSGQSGTSGQGQQQGGQSSGILFTTDNIRKLSDLEGIGNKVVLSSGGRLEFRVGPLQLGDTEIPQSAIRAIKEIETKHGNKYTMLLFPGGRYVMLTEQEVDNYNNGRPWNSLLTGNIRTVGQAGQPGDGLQQQQQPVVRGDSASSSQTTTQGSGDRGGTGERIPLPGYKKVTLPDGRIIRQAIYDEDGETSSTSQTRPGTTPPQRTPQQVADSSRTPGSSGTQSDQTEQLGRVLLTGENIQALSGLQPGERVIIRRDGSVYIETDPNAVVGDGSFPISRSVVKLFIKRTDDGFGVLVDSNGGYNLLTSEEVEKYKAGQPWKAAVSGKMGIVKQGTGTSGQTSSTTGPRAPQQGQDGGAGNQGQSGTGGQDQSGTGGSGQSGASGQDQSGAGGSGQSGAGGQGTTSSVRRGTSSSMLLVQSDLEKLSKVDRNKDVVLTSSGLVEFRSKTQPLKDGDLILTPEDIRMLKGILDGQRQGEGVSLIDKVIKDSLSGLDNQEIKKLTDGGQLGFLKEVMSNSNGHGIIVTSEGKFKLINPEELVKYVVGNPWQKVAEGRVGTKTKQTQQSGGSFGVQGLRSETLFTTEKIKTVLDRLGDNKRFVILKDGTTKIVNESDISGDAVLVLTPGDFRNLKGLVESKAGGQTINSLLSKGYSIHGKDLELVDRTVGQNEPLAGAIVNSEGKVTFLGPQDLIKHILGQEWTTTDVFNVGTRTGGTGTSSGTSSVPQAPPLPTGQRSEPRTGDIQGFNVTAIQQAKDKLKPISGNPGDSGESPSIPQAPPLPTGQRSEDRKGDPQGFNTTAILQAKDSLKPVTENPGDSGQDPSIPQAPPLPTGQDSDLSSGTSSAPKTDKSGGSSSEDTGRRGVSLELRENLGTRTDADLQKEVTLEGSELMTSYGKRGYVRAFTKFFEEKAKESNKSSASTWKGQITIKTDTTGDRVKVSGVDSTSVSTESQVKPLQLSPEFLKQLSGDSSKKD